jgi:ribosome-binding factor A
MARQDKVSEAIKQEISNIIQTELKDPRIGFITVTSVEITHDLRYAKVFFSVLGKEEEHEKTKEALDSALGFIRRLIAQRIRLRFAPEISFREDRSAEYSIEIQEALDEIKKLSPPAPEAKEVKPRKKRVKKSEPKKSSRVRKKA